MSKLRTVWVDGVGGYAIYDPPEAIFGGRGANKESIEIVSELPKLALSVKYLGDEYIVQRLAAKTVEVNGVIIPGPFVLSDGDEMKVDGSVRLLFTKPSSLSNTAVLKIKSRHRWPESIDGVILLRGLCVLGPSVSAHVNCKQWSQDITLFRQEDLWQYRLQSKTRSEHGLIDCTLKHISGRSVRKPSHPIVLGERVRGDDFSMTIT